MSDPITRFPNPAENVGGVRLSLEGVGKRYGQREVLRHTQL